MKDTKPTSIRLDPETREKINNLAKRRKWSQHKALIESVKSGLAVEHLKDEMEEDRDSK